MATTRRSYLENFTEIAAENTIEQCQYCSKELTRPRLFPCFHTFCTNCVEDTIKSSLDKVKFLCHLCKTPFTTPDNGANGFPINVYAYSTDKGNNTSVCHVCDKNEAKKKCLECEKFYCQDCSPAHVKKKVTRTHKLISIQPGGVGGMTSRTHLFCFNHMTEELSLYCMECKLPICFICKRTAHEGHSCEDIEHKATTMRENLSAEISQIGSARRRLHLSKIEAMKKAKSKLSTEVKKCRTEILDQVEKIKCLLDDYAKSEINKLEAGLVHHTSVCDEAIREEESKMVSLVSQFFEMSRYVQNAPSAELIGMYGDISEVISIDKRNVPCFEKDTIVYKTIPKVSKGIITELCGRADVHVQVSRQLKLYKKRQIDLQGRINAVCPLTDTDVLYSTCGDQTVSTIVWRIQGDCVSKVFDARDFVTKIMKDIYGNIYAATDSCLVKWKPGDDSTEEIDLPDSAGLFHMSENNEQNEFYMLSRSTALYKYNWKQKQFTYRGKNVNLSSAVDDCEDMIVNKLGNIFISHKKDILMCDNNLCNKGKVVKDDCSFFGLASSQDGLMYAADNDKHCIHLLSEDGLYLQKLKTPNGCFFSGDISIDQSGQCWVGCNGKIVVFDIKEE